MKEVMWVILLLNLPLEEQYAMKVLLEGTNFIKWLLIFFLGKIH